MCCYFRYAKAETVMMTLKVSSGQRVMKMSRMTIFVGKSEKYFLLGQPVQAAVVWYHWTDCWNKTINNRTLSERYIDNLLTSVPEVIINDTK